MKVLEEAQVGAKLVVFNKTEKGWIAFPLKLWKQILFNLRNVKLFMFLILKPKEKLQIPLFGTVNGRVLKEIIIIIMVPTSTMTIPTSVNICFINSLLRLSNPSSAI